MTKQKSLKKKIKKIKNHAPDAKVLQWPQIKLFTLR